MKGICYNEGDLLEATMKYEYYDLPLTYSLYIRRSMYHDRVPFPLIGYILPHLDIGDVSPFSIMKMLKVNKIYRIMNSN